MTGEGCTPHTRWRLQGDSPHQAPPFILPGAASAADRADCTAAVRNSCLAPFLIHQLAKTSFQDMAGR